MKSYDDPGPYWPGSLACHRQAGGEDGAVAATRLRWSGVGAMLAVRRGRGVAAVAALALAVATIAVGFAATGCGRGVPAAGGSAGGVAGAAGGGGAASGEFPVTIRDARGQEVVIATAPRRIVSLAPSVTEILFAIGAGPAVVGVDDYSNYPPEAATRTRVGAYWPPNVEQVVALRPDLVIASGEHADWADQMERLGVKVLLVDARTVEDVTAITILVGRATGKTRQAMRVSEDVRRRVQAVKQRVARLPEEQRPRVYYEMYWDPLMTVGPQSLIGQLIELAGGRNIAADAATAYPEFSVEAVIDRDPQVIVFPDVHAPNMPTVEDLKARPGFALVSAVRDGRVHALDADVISRPGPRVAEAVEELARLFYPEVFK